MTPLQSALDAARAVVAGVRDDQWALPTPCPEWTVADLVEHVTAGNRLFAAAMGGAAAPSGNGVDRLDAWDRAAAQLGDAFGAPDALSRTVTVPFGTVPAAVALHLRITELLVHGWDLAVATQQQLVIADEVAQQELEFSRGALAQVPPDRSPFGPPQAAPAGATALEELVALLGRSVPR